MPRSYRHIKNYEKEILELKENGLTHKEIAEKYGLTKEHIKQFFNRYNRKQKKLASGISIKPKGRPRKDGNELPPSIQQLSKLTQMQYELASKERYKVPCCVFMYEISVTHFWFGLSALKSLFNKLS